MEKRTIIKISGVVIAFAGIFGTAAYMESRKEDKLGDENAYMRIRPATGKVRDGNKKSFYARYVKRGLDFVLSALGLVMLLPLLAILSAIIFLDDPGPVIFKQKRVGKDRKLFFCHKFRSMKMGAPHDVPTHQLEEPEKYITRVGRVLRWTSMDELPQMWDILRGKMSVVGPRPALWNQYDLVEERDKYCANDVLPGLTGLAQISGRDKLEIAEKARIDGEYCRRMGFRMDLECFFGTIASVLRHDGVVEGGTGSFGEKGSDNGSKFVYRRLCKRVSGQRS